LKKELPPVPSTKSMPGGRMPYATGWMTAEEWQRRNQAAAEGDAE
jgi:hypothetical protein